MKLVYQLKPEESEKDYGVKFGGGAFLEEEWPENPNGEDLVLLFTIEVDKLKKYINLENLPCNKKISVFSTYSKDRYFLDDIVYFGGEEEFDYIKKGYTKVIACEKNDIVNNANQIAPRKIKIEERKLSDEDYPVFSFISDELPLGLVGGDKLKEDYVFICQVYSADLSKEDGGILGLSDAIGYLFLRKNITDNSDAGFFFVQTA